MGSWRRWRVEAGQSAANRDPWNCATEQSFAKLGCRLTGYLIGDSTDNLTEPRIRQFVGMPRGSEAYSKILRLVREHERWFADSLPMIASENVTSRRVREVLSSDLGHRYAEGWPGERVYAGCKYIDEVELLAIEMAKKLFRAEFVDVRPTSGVGANLAVYSAFTSPGDIMLALSIPNGGHISTGKKEFSGSAGLVHGLEIEYFAFDKGEMNIDVDETKKRISKLHEAGKVVKMAMFGGSLFLFPHPVRELTEAVIEAGGLVCYDAAHVAGLVAGGQFQDPLREGAEVMTFSTHKTLFGPQGGAIASSLRLSEEIKKAVFPGTTSNHHLHSVAGKVEEMNIIVNRQLIPGDLQAGRHYTNPGGVRLGVSELTRLGMRRSDMIDVAEIIHLGLSTEKGREARRRIHELRAPFRTVKYSFGSSPAYFFS